MFLPPLLPIDTRADLPALIRLDGRRQAHPALQTAYFVLSTQLGEYWQPTLKHASAAVFAASLFDGPLRAA